MASRLAALALALPTNVDANVGGGGTLHASDCAPLAFVLLLLQLLLVLLATKRDVRGLLLLFLLLLLLVVIVVVVDGLMLALALYYGTFHKTKQTNQVFFFCLLNFNKYY